LKILCVDNYLLKRQTITILIMNISRELFKKKINRLTLKGSGRYWGFSSQIRINVSSVFTFNKLCVIFCRHVVDYSLSTLYIFVIQCLNLDIYHPLFSFYFGNTVWFVQRSVCDHGTFSFCLGLEAVNNEQHLSSKIDWCN
jgi:hypothetical protein